MHLITVAHLGEAQSIIERFNLERISSHFYKGENLHCLITGEGPFEAAVTSAKALGSQNYSQVINLGIAGSLHSEFEVGSFHQVRSIYLVVEGSPQFKSFAAHTEGLDLITSFERILSPEKIKPLLGLGSLVDREAWGVAMAAKSSQVPFACYKIISDMAGSLDACELVKEQANVYAERLALELGKLLTDKKSGASSDVQLAGFYFTFTSQRKFENLLKKLSLRENKTTDEVLSVLKLEELRAMKLMPKERGLMLIAQMELILDPFKGKLNHRLKEWKAPFEQQQIMIGTDPNWEEVGIRITLDVKKQDELEHKLTLLKQLNLSVFESMRDGKL